MLTDSSLQRLDIAIVVGSGPDGRSTIPAALRAGARRVLATPDVAGALRAAEEAQPQLVIIRQSIPVADALRFIRGAKEVSNQSAVVVVADRSCIEHAVKLVGAGAHDYVQGPLTHDSVVRLLDSVCSPDPEADSQRFFCDYCPPDVKIVGRSEAMTAALEMIAKVARSRCNPILILGETGTGKELAARAVHSWRCGPDDRFVAVNCAALNASLLESELFGHVKGAFTGAEREKIGLFELAGSGTIFLDEISEMPPELQAKLLRVLQDRSFRKVGGTKDLTCEATVIASSNRPLFAEAADGRFRKDLYYRLAVFPITLPPLRDHRRSSDVLLLAEYFLRNSQIVPSGSVVGLDSSACEKLLSHHWPGNVRELRNVIDRALILAHGRRVGAESIQLGDPCVSKTCPHVDAPVPAEEARQTATTDPKAFSLETAEREFIMRALRETGWQRTRAAALLGITRATLHTKLKRYDIHPPGVRAAAAVAV